MQPAITLRPYQERAVGLMIRHLYDFPQAAPILVAPCACHARGARVVQHSGETLAVENVLVGDTLLGPDGKARNVLKTFRGFDQLYKITPKRGVPFVVNGHHVLSLQYISGATKTRKDFVGVKNIKLNEFLLLKKSERACLTLRRSDFIQFAERDAPTFDPWLLGALIGDGSFGHGYVSFASPDMDLLSAIESAVIKEGAIIGSRRIKRVNVDCHHWCITSPLGKKGRHGSNTIMAFLRNCGLSGATAAEKFVPDDFKYGSIETRFNVLAGLLDTDGHLDKQNGYDWISKSPQLADDFVFIARSLGIRATLSVETKGCQGGFSGMYYRVHLSGNTFGLPLRCVRKRAGPRRMNKNPLLDSFHIEPLGIGEFFGFTLDSDHLYLTDDFVIHHNSGKSVMLAALAERLSGVSSGMFLILTHRRELVAQTASKLPSHMQVGVYSAGLGRKELRRITVAGFQSIRKHAKALPKISYIAIDECEFAARGYREFIDEVRIKSPDVRVMGCTATPYLGDANRTALHLLPADKQIFTSVAAEVQISELLALGYLCPLTPYKGRVHLDTSGVAINAITGDFAVGELEAAVDTDTLNTAAAREIVEIFSERRSIVVFVSGVAHATHMRDALRALGQSVEMVLGDTPMGERDAIIANFRAGKLKYIVGVDVLLVGWDVTRLDGIAMLRPTLSARVYVQALGRGMRIDPIKQDTLVCDFTDNTDTHGPIDEIEGNPPKLKTGEAPTKICDNCFSIVLAGLKKCPACGYEFEFKESDNQQNFDPTTGLLISGVTKNEDGSKTYPVERVEYELRTTAAGNPALVAQYMSAGRRSPVATSYYNLWHHSAGAVQRDSALWLRRQANPGGSVPLSAQEALVRAEMGCLKTPRTVTVRPGSPFPIRFSM